MLVGQGYSVLVAKVGLDSVKSAMRVLAVCFIAAAVAGVGSAVAVADPAADPHYKSAEADRSDAGHRAHERNSRGPGCPP